MFGWLWKWFAKREQMDLYSPRERFIYRYLDGKTEVAADPAVLYRRMMDVGPELSADITVGQSPSKRWREAQENGIRKIRGIFSVKPFEEGGLTEGELYGLLDHFIQYCETVKKNSPPSPTSLPSTQEPPDSSSDAESVTSSSLVSGSTASVPFTAAPAPSPTVPGSPSASLPPVSNTTNA